MAKSFLETVKSDEPIFFINALCGLGDIVSHLSRLPAVKEKYPNHTVVFLLGGFGGSPRLMKEMAERQGELALIIKNYAWVNQHDTMEEFIKKTYVKETRGDIYETWSFCKEIFNNAKPSFLNYEMAFPYTYNTSSTPELLENFYGFTNSKTVVIKPFTTEGNPEGFEHDVENNRFWTTEKWVHLIEKLREDNFVPIFIGLKKDLQDLPEQCKKKNLQFLDFSDRSIEDTILVINNSNGCITTNSWEWGIAARAGLPTVCVYLKNHFFLPVHIPQGPSSIWDNLYVETDALDQEPQSAQKIIDVFNFFTDHKKRPEKKYSVCMITYNDEECVRDTMENVTPYVTDDFVITDGGSTDKTISIIEEYDTNLIHKKWEDNFEIQKNNSLDAANQEWRVLIDADEEFEHLFWNQLPWHILRADYDGVDCISVPRINIVDGLTQDMVEENGWQLSHFNWVNYPDYQQRVYKRNCKYSGRTHERIVGSTKSSALVGQHIVHRKSYARQQRGLKREHDQYKIAATNVKEKLNLQYGNKLLIQCVESLSDDEKTIAIENRMKFLIKHKDNFHYALAFPAHIDLAKEEDFVKLMGEDNMIKFGSIPELFYILEETKPYIVHMLTDIDMETNLANSIRGKAKHFIEKNIDGTPEDSLSFYRRIGA